jgi:heme exporter protein C
LSTESLKKPPTVGGTIDRFVMPACIVGFLLILTAFVLAFTTAPLVGGANVGGTAIIGGQAVGSKLLFSQKIFYFHMPIAITSFLALIFVAYYGIRYLTTKQRAYDTRSRVAMEITLIFVIGTMISGELWEREEWGVWWTWEPRLTTYLVLMLLVIAYFILRTAIDDPEKRATFAAVFGIITFIDAPICFMITRLIPQTTHPVISSLSVDMLIPLMISLVGFLLIGFVFYRLRLRQAICWEKLEAIKERLLD